LQPRGEATEEATGVARRRIEVNDVVEVLVQWQTGRRVKQIARSTGLARNTVRKYLAQVSSRAGLQRQPALPRAELWAKVSENCPELVDRAACTDLAGQLRELHDEIVTGLKESTAATVWQRLRDAGRLSCSITSFRRYLYREVREVDPQRVVVRRPEPALGEQAEIDFGVLGSWTDPATGRRRRLWAFVMVLGAKPAPVRTPGLAARPEDLDPVPRRGVRVLRLGAPPAGGRRRTCCRSTCIAGT
jgi:hypothetical protein